MTQTMAHTDREIHHAVLREFQWDSRVDGTDIDVAVHQGVVTLTGTIGSYGKKVAVQEAAHRVAGVLDVADNIVVNIEGTPYTDTEIAFAVRHMLQWDGFIPHEKINSTVTGGYVMLCGEVPLWADREGAERLIRNLTGVAGVINNIRVHPFGLRPSTIREAIEAALERRAEREARRIEVQVDDGTVILCGKVHTWDEKRAILGAAGHAPGVRKVEDHLEIGIPGR